MSGKLTSCMKLVNSMDEQDQDALLDRLGQYQKDGIKPERAQLMAASDTLAELEAERKEFMAMLREQHPDIFLIKPDEQEDADDQSIKKSKGRSRAGGQVADSNGFFYKGGQFLPATSAEPGKWKVNKKWVTSGRELVAPGELAYQPTPFSRSLFTIAGLGYMTRLQGGKLELNPGANGNGVRDYRGNPITLDTEITPGVKGVMGKESLTLGEIVDAWNSGQRWFDVKPDADVLTTDIKKSRARDVTETPEFKRWSEGLPVHASFADRSSDRGIFKLYHMTTADFNEFKPGGLSPTDSGPAIWLSTDPAATSSAFRVGNAERGFREGARTMPVYGKVKNPLVIDDAGMLDYAREAFADGSREFPQLISKSAAAALKEEGHDSIIFDGPGVGWKGAPVEIIVFDGGQVKSIIGNSGAFDPASKDIRKSTGRNAMGFYSALAKGIDSMPTKAAPAGAWKAQIKGLVNKGAVKQDEVTWSGLEDWMDLQTGKITKEQIAAYLEQGGVKVNETTLGGDTKMSDELRAYMEDTGRPMPQGVGEWADEAQMAEAAANRWEASGRRQRADQTRALAAEMRSINKTTGGGTKYSQYTLPGGKNYREVLLTLPSAADEGSDAIKRLRSATNETEYNAARGEIDRARSAQYRSSHWDQPNVLAHIRTNDRTDADGNKVLFVEEVQSDWGQDGKKKGFDDPSKKPVTRKDFEDYADRLLDDYIAQQVQTGEGRQEASRRGINMNPAQLAHELGRSEEYDRMREGREKDMLGKVGIPPAPFVTKTDGWLNLALKRIVAMAVDGGYDKVAFVNGEQSAGRYDLSKQVDALTLKDKMYTMGEPGLFVIAEKDGRNTIERTVKDQSELSDLVGKEVADRLMSAPMRGGERRLSGLDLKVGGEGMKTFYDSIVPSAVKKLISKMDGRLETVNLGNAAEDFDPWDLDNATDEERAELEATGRVSGLRQPGFTVTPKMVEQVSGQGMPLFSRARNPQEDTQEFKDWSEGAPVIHLGERHEFKSGQPVVVEALHGTTNSDLTEFKRERANIESDWGAGFYASNTPDDVATNYANNEGADLTQRIELMAERLAANEFDDDMEAAREEAKRRLTQESPNTLKLYIRMSNPAVQGGKGETFFDYTEEYDEETDSYAEPTGKLVDFVESLRNVADEFDGLDADQAMASVWEKAGDYEGISLTDLVSTLKASDAMIDVADDDGNSASTEVIRRALEDMGFDGVIDTTVLSKFGPRMIKGAYTNVKTEGMKGMNKDTVHFIAFDPTQLKSATGNSGAFSRTNRDITKSTARNPQEDTPEFKAWFGDSKVVDEQGRPLVVYHGTKGAFDSFDIGRATKNYGLAEYETSRGGAFFTTDKAFSKEFAGKGGVVMDVYLSIQNPLDLSDGYPNNFYLKHGKMLQENNILSMQPTDMWEMLDDGFPGSDEFIAAVKADGHDGLKMVERDASGEAKDVYVVFKPTQIKSATGNQGTFDPKNPDIRKSTERTATPDFVVDDERGKNVLYAEFDDGAAYVQFAGGKDGKVHVLAINAEESESVRGRDMLRWLADTYGKPVVASEVAPDARRYWNRMEDEGLVEDWSEEEFSGETISLSIKKSKERTTGDYGRQYTPQQLAMFKNTGRTTDLPTLRERLKEARKDIGKKMAQGIVDQFRPLKDLGGDGYMLARLSKGAAGAFEALLSHGKLKIVDGAYDADMSGGFIEEIGKPLGKEVEDFMWHIAAMRAERLKAEDRENLFTDDDIAAGKSLATGQMERDYTLANGQVTRDRALAYADAAKKFDVFNRNVLDIAEQSGLIDGDSRQYWEGEFYVPFYRVSDEDGEFVGAKIKGGLARQRAFHELKGGNQKLNSDLLANTLKNWSHLIDASAKNRAAKATLEAATNVGIAMEADEETVRQMGKSIGKKGGSVWFMDGGQKRHFLVGDPYVLEAINSLEYAGMRGPLMDALSATKHWLTVGVTASPAFKVRNLIRDTISAIGISGLSYNPVQNLRDGYMASDRSSQEYVSALASGGLIRFGTMAEGNASEHIRRLVKQGVKPATILDSDEKLKAFYAKYVEPAVDAYNEIGNRGEEVNRSALYSQLRKQGMSHAEASLQARDMMDFSMQGTWASIRFLTQVVPFMNARLQGLYRLGKGATEDPRRFAMVTGAVAMFSVALLAAYGDDDDWKKREDFDRDGFWWFKLGGTAFRIPKPFEIGAIATIAERGVELFTNDKFTAKRFGERVLHLVGDNLAMNPIPQAVKPMLDVYANKDSFSGRPIESMGMERLQAEYRYNSHTSMVARGMSTALNTVTRSTVGADALSPVQIDSMLRGYFGWLGTFVVAGADMAVRPLTSEPTRPQADYLKVVTQGFLRSLPEDQSKYVSALYEQSKKLEEAYATHRQLVKEGKVDNARDFAAENKDLLERYRLVEAVKQAQAKINKRVREIEISDMDPAKKREEIGKLRQQASVSAEKVY